MSQYYFLAASLPYILPDSQMIMDRNEFLSTCESNMSAEDYSLLLSCRLDPAAEEESEAAVHPLVRRWNDWEISFRNELVKIRAQNLKTDGESFLRETPGVAGLFETVKEASGLASPLEAELKLDRIRWTFLDELETGHMFDLEKMMVYFLKLQLLERRDRFSPEKGEDSYRTIYQAVVSQIQGSPSAV